MGAKGHNVFENFLYGGVTETFLDKFDTCLVIIVR